MILILSLSCSEEQDKNPIKETVQYSMGCGLDTVYVSGAEQIEVDWPDAGGERSYFLSIPESYSPEIPHSVVFGFSGTDWLGADIQVYL
ncbi:MAG: hypothetical protein CMK59_09825, partial [Proteobacteria bacterium]|nr:hypothetical protein [Pseudomonadota bacterium]